MWASAWDLIGEATTPTPYGRGAEALLPLTDETWRRFGESLAAAGGSNTRVHVTFGVDTSGNLQVRKIARDEIDREHAYRMRVG